MSNQILKTKWVLAYRLRYKKTLKAPNRLVVWDVRENYEYETDKFELVNCKIGLWKLYKARESMWC